MRPAAWSSACPDALQANAPGTIVTARKQIHAIADGLGPAAGHTFTAANDDVGRWLKVLICRARLGRGLLRHRRKSGLGTRNCVPPRRTRAWHAGRVMICSARW